MSIYGFGNQTFKDFGTLWSVLQKVTPWNRQRGELFQYLEINMLRCWSFGVQSGDLFCRAKDPSPWFQTKTLNQSKYFQADRRRTGFWLLSFVNVTTRPFSTPILRHWNHVYSASSKYVIETTNKSEARLVWSNKKSTSKKIKTP